MMALHYLRWHLLAGEAFLLTASAREQWRYWMCGGLDWQGQRERLRRVKTCYCRHVETCDCIE